MLLVLACAEPTLGPVTETDAGLALTTHHAAEELGRGALQYGIPDPAWIEETYIDLVQNAGERCPAFAGEDTIYGWWFDECLTEEGYGFWGGGSHGDRLEGAGFAHVAQYTLVRPDGSQFVGGGMIVVSEGAISYGGTFWDSGSELPLLDAGFEVAQDGGETSIEGGFGYGSRAVSFDDDVVSAECSDAPTGGEVDVRRRDGGWVTLSWDDCSPCGPVLEYGEVVGEHCLGPDVVAAVDELAVASGLKTE